MRTSQQEYAGLNNRFDKRARRLLKCGFTYKQLPYGSVFSRVRWGCEQWVTVATVQLASNLVWIDNLKRLLNR